MRTLVLDTSVAAAWYLPESFSAEARSYQTGLIEGRIHFVVPSLHYWELANVLRTYVRRRELKPALARDIYSLHLDAPIEITEPDRPLVLQTALEFETTAYDAVYISLARALGVPLLTAERKTTPWVVRLGRLAESVTP